MEYLLLWFRLLSLLCPECFTSFPLFPYLLLSLRFCGSAVPLLEQPPDVDDLSVVSSYCSAWGRPERLRPPSSTTSWQHKGRSWWNALRKLSDRKAYRIGLTQLRRELQRRMDRREVFFSSMRHKYHGGTYSYEIGMEPRGELLNHCGSLRTFRHILDNPPQCPRPGTISKF